MPGIRWHLAVPPEVTTEYAGTSLGAYYTDAETQWRTQHVARERFHDLYGVELPGPRAEPSAYSGVASLGAEVTYPPDDPPQVRGHVLRHAGDLARLALPARYLESEAMRPFVAIQQWMQARAEPGRRIPLGVGIEGPITSAKLLRGQEFFTDLYDHPREAHRLLELVTESFIACCREVRRFNGSPVEGGGAGIADDFAGLIAPAMWPEFVVPYYHRIYEAFGEGPRSQHSELLRPAHLPFLVELGVTSFDPGQDQYLSVTDILAAAPGLPFTWNLKTMLEMHHGTPDSIRRAYAEAVGLGATAIMAEPCRGTPPQNLRAFVAVAGEFE